VGEALSPEKRHERGSEGVDTLIEGFQGAFTADGVAQQHDHKVDHVVMAEPTPGEAHLLLNRRKHAHVPKIVRGHGHFLDYVIMPLSLIVWHVEAIREVG